VNKFIDHLHVVTTNNYNIVADFHTKSSQSTFPSLTMAIPLQCFH
jgi:hypothetical protein